MKIIVDKIFNFYCSLKVLKAFDKTPGVLND